MHQNGQLDDAKKKYKEILKINSKEYAALRHLGMIYQSEGKLSKALTLFQKALNESKGLPECYNNIGTIYFDNNKDELAVEWFKKSLSLNSEYSPALNNISLLYARNLDKKNALYYSKKSLDLQPNNILTLNSYALALLLNNKVLECIDILESLIKQKIPDNILADALSNLGAAYRDNGDLKKSFENYIKAHNIKPFDAHIFRNLSHSKFYNPKEDELLKLESYCATIIDNEQKGMYCFGLHNVFEKFKDYEKSFHYLNIANNILDKITKFDLKKEIHLFDNIKKIFSSKFESGSTLYNEDKSKIFILGMPRSGTSLVEQIIASHSKVHGCGELEFLTDACSLFDFAHQNNKNDNILNNYKKKIQRL